MQKVISLKKEMAKKLEETAKQLSSQDKMRVCLKMEISSKTFDRYTSGDEKEVRRLLFAEDLQKQIENYLK